MQTIVVVMFTLSAAMKFLRTEQMVKHWTEYRYPFPLMSAIAVLETLGALGMLAGFRYSGIVPYSAALLAALMLGAIHAHLFRAKHKPYMAVNAFAMLYLSVSLIAIR